MFGPTPEPPAALQGAVLVLLLDAPRRMGTRSDTIDHGLPSPSPGFVPAGQGAQPSSDAAPACRADPHTPGRRRHMAAQLSARHEPSFSNILA